MGTTNFLHLQSVSNFPNASLWCKLTGQRTLNSSMKRLLRPVTSPGPPVVATAASTGFFLTCVRVSITGEAINCDLVVFKSNGSLLNRKLVSCLRWVLADTAPARFCTPRSMPSLFTLLAVMPVSWFLYSLIRSNSSICCLVRFSALRPFLKFKFELNLSDLIMLISN